MDHSDSLFLLLPTSSNGGEGGCPEWAMLELQGELETRHPVPLSGKLIGDLHFTHAVRLFLFYFCLFCFRRPVSMSQIKLHPNHQLTVQ
jgi:hypothetical protein